MKAQYLVVWSGLPDEKAIWEDKEKLVSEGWEKSIEDFERTLPPEEQEVNRKKELQRKKLGCGKDNSDHKEGEAKTGVKTTSERRHDRKEGKVIEDDGSRDLGELPPFIPHSAPNFKWGERDSGDFIKDVHWAFEITSGWRKNVFKLPKGSAGKHFTQALSKLYLSYAERTALECVSLKAASIIVPLLLQQPASKTSYKENKRAPPKTSLTMARPQYQGAHS